jgi:hypothetical protein
MRSGQIKRDCGEGVPLGIDHGVDCLYSLLMATLPKELPGGALKGMSEEHRQMVAEGIATMHRFAAEPSFKHGKPRYKAGQTVAAIQHTKTKCAGR